MMLLLLFLVDEKRWSGFSREPKLDATTSTARTREDGERRPEHQCGVIWNPVDESNEFGKKLD